MACLRLHEASIPPGFQLPLGLLHHETQAEGKFELKCGLAAKPSLTLESLKNDSIPGYSVNGSRGCIRIWYMLSLNSKEVHQILCIFLSDKGTSVDSFLFYF